MDFVYYLYSEKLGKHYIGKTNALEVRLYEHNIGKDTFTKTGMPWQLVGYINCEDNGEASKLENRLKKAKNPKYVKWYIKQNGVLME